MYSTKNVTFRAYEIDASVIARAAAKANKSLSDYCRDILIPWAYSDIGERRVPLPPLEAGRYSNMVDTAAAKAGMSREAFERHAVEECAAAALGVAGPSDSAPPPPLRVVPPAPVRRASGTVERQRDGRFAGRESASASGSSAK